MLIGGLAGSITFHAERYLSRTQPAYPAELNQKLEPHLPRNGELVTSVAPPAAMWVLARRSPKLTNIRNGSFFYSIPHLIQAVVVNAAYAEGVAARPTARLAAPIATRYIPSQSSNQVARPAASTGKYRLTS
jgi:hypothetical protein